MTSEFAVAVHAMVFLNHKGEVVSSEQLAENICTNPARVRKVMAKIKKAGFLGAREGSVGGYKLEIPADKLSLADIAKALDEKYVTSNWKSGSKDMDCLIACGMAGIMDGIYGQLNEACEKMLEGITVADLDKKIFG